jgi:hypothetical protein
MDSKQRLASLEKTLKLRYEALNKAEEDLAMTTDTFEVTRIEQRIRERVLPKIRKYEREYWDILAAEAPSCEVAEVDASQAIVKVVQEVELIQSQPNKYPYELMDKLQEILDKLNERDTAAAAKLKAALHLVPGIISYEVELDTEILLKRVFDRMKKLFKQAIDEKEKKTHK